MKKLKEILDGCLFTDGDWIESKDQDPNGEIRLIQLADIGDGTFLDKSNRFVNRATALKLNCTYLKKGDIIISRMPDPLGRCCIFPLDGDQKYITAVDVCIIRPGANISNVYLKNIINSTSIRHEIERQSTGTTRRRISRKKLGDLLIPLPPLETQKKIAEILDAADTLRQKTKTLIEKYDQLTQSIFLNMFGNPMINHKSWITKELKNLGKVVTGSTPSSTKKDMFGGSIPFVTPGDLESLYPVKRSLTELGSINSRTVKKGSLLVCCIGATIGKTDIAKEMSAFNQQINAVEWLNEVNSHYALIAFKYLRQRVISRGISTTLPILKKSEFEKIKLPLPPLTLQNQFAERVQAIEEQKAKAQASLEKSEELFQSLLQRAFKGKLV